SWIPPQLHLFHQSNFSMKSIIRISIVNEVGEKLAMVGFLMSMISYLRRQLHMLMMQAANTFTNFSGTASLTPLLGAFIANSFAGRFWTRTVASIIYQNPDMLPKLGPPLCAYDEIWQEANQGQLGNK
nr:hypothetical protein [Tanacetum cinerariifolium]